MKVQIKHTNLARALAIVGRMVRQRATLPVLSNILIASDKGRLKLAATDLESAVSVWIGAKIDEEGAITLPARTLTDYIASASDESIELSGRGSDILIKSERYKATIKGIAAEEFPIIAQVKSENSVFVGASDLKTAILSTAVAAATDETRPVLAGLLFRIKGEQVKIVATDSYRLAEATIKSSKAAEPLEFIIPARTAAELGRILPASAQAESASSADGSADGSQVEITVGDNQAEFKFADVQFLSRQIEGAFPDYEQIIPKEFVYQFEVSKASFNEAIRAAAVIARDAGNNIKLACLQNSIVISAMAAQVGDAEASLQVGSSGEPLTIAFNAKYILDALSILSDETLNFAFSGALSASLISSKGDSGFRYVIMPLRSE